MIDKEIIAVFHYDDKGSKCCGAEPYRYAEEIIRCKECKHWRNTDAEKIPTASIACGNMHADDFCSYGVRKESE